MVSRRFSVRAVTVSLATLVLSSSSPAAVFNASGADPASIQTAVDNFRAALGPLNPNVAGSFGTGRREINWDGVPDAAAAPNLLPANFFNTTSPRGAVFSGLGPGFAVSADSSNPTATPVRFGNLNAAYPGNTQAFSAERLFTNLGNNVVQIDFFVPGTNTPATVAGFGAVFTDVEVAAQTKYTVFLGDGSNGGQFAVPTGPDGGLSFLGLTDPNRYSRIIIQSGNVVPGVSESLTALQDVVFMDDFIYGEPLGVPEPASLAIAGAASIAMLRRGRRR